MAINGFDPTDPRVQLEIVRERLKNSDGEVRKLEGNLAHVYTDLGRKKAELERIRDDRDALKIKLTVAERDLGHTQELLKLSNKRAKQKGWGAVIRTISANLLYLLSAVCTGFGTSMLTSTPPNSLGWMMLALALVVYLVGTVIIATRGGDE